MLGGRVGDEDAMIRKLTPKKRQERYDHNYLSAMRIYQRATQGGSAAYAVNQKSDDATVNKILAEAEDRRQRRAQRRKQWAESAGLI